jgi:hypothetical protein
LSNAPEWQWSSAHLLLVDQDLYLVQALVVLGEKVDGCLVLGVDLGVFGLF